VRQKKEAPLLWASLAVVAVVGAGVLRLDTRNSLAAQFFEVNGPMHGFRLADERTAGTRVVQVLVEGKAPDAIKNPEVLRRMDALATHVKGLNLPVGKVVSVADVLKVMNRVIANDDPKAEVLPESPEAAAQFFLLYSMSGDEEDLRRLVDAEYRAPSSRCTSRPTTTG
jgi:predicted RND superfamily exporter protein